MPFDIKTESDLASLEAKARSMKSSGQPAVLSVADLMALDVAPPSMLIEGFLPGSGASLMFGAPKSNKTLLAVQMAIAVASGNPLFDYYRVLTPGPVLLVEQDDPAGAASFKDILQRSPVPVAPRRLLKSKISRCALPPLKEPLKRVRNDESAKASPEA